MKTVYTNNERSVAVAVVDCCRWEKRTGTANGDQRTEGGGLWFVANKITRSLETRKIPKKTKTKTKKKRLFTTGVGPHAVLNNASLRRRASKEGSSCVNNSPAYATTIPKNLVTRGGCKLHSIKPFKQRTKTKAERVCVGVEKAMAPRAEWPYYDLICNKKQIAIESLQSWQRVSRILF